VTRHGWFGGRFRSCARKPSASACSPRSRFSSPRWRWCSLAWAPYGALDYVIVGRLRELGIRIALGAPHADIARRVTLEVFSMLLLGAAAGLTLGLASAALGSIPPFPPHRRSARPRRRRGSRWEIGFAAKGRIRASIRMWWMYQAESTSVFMPS
jgi:hypothetical protein